MKRRDWLRSLLVLAAAIWGGIASAAPQESGAVGDVKALGNERYQIGSIIIDKSARTFKLPGRIIVSNAPLEYLAGSPKGRKNYEALLELDATSIEFNLACILVGLEASPNQVPYHQFSKLRLVGPRVAIRIEWQEGGKARTMSAAEAVLNPEAGVKPDAVEWVYTGRSFVPLEQGAPDPGTLVGFVHDPHTIIEAMDPIGIGAYGSVRGNAGLPPPGTSIELVVDVVRNGK